ncbi:hypothetical protein ACMDXX_000441 [Enterococcus faecalis]|uniref:hypothetical protein n=1 Tax=Enterococcus sp. GC34 TaxID=3231353 RepID=UPI0034A029D4
MKQFQQVHVREYGEFMFDFIRSQEINKNESLEDCIECKFLPVCEGVAIIRDSVKRLNALKIHLRVILSL